jgi:hypothetical protein
MTQAPAIAFHLWSTAPLPSGEGTLLFSLPIDTAIADLRTWHKISSPLWMCLTSVGGYTLAAALDRRGHRQPHRWTHRRVQLP